MSNKNKLNKDFISLWGINSIEIKEALSEIVDRSWKIQQVLRVSPFRSENGITHIADYIVIVWDDTQEVNNE